MKDNKELKRYNILVDDIAYPTFEKASEAIGEKSITLYMKVIRCISKGLPFERIINGKNVFVEEIKFDRTKKIVLASVRVSTDLLEDKEYVEQLKLELLRIIKLSEEEKKDVYYEIGTEGDDFMLQKATIKAVYKK